MKILFLTRRFYPDIGGVEKHVFEISKELIKRGHKITVMTESPTSPSLRGTSPLRQSVSEASNYHSRDQSDIYDINSKEAVNSAQTTNFEAGNINVLRLNFGKNNWLKKFRIWRELMRLSGTVRDADVVHSHDVFFWYLPFRFLFPRKKIFTTFHGYETKVPPTIKSKLIRKLSEQLSMGCICVGDYIKKWYGTKPDYITYGGVEKNQKSKIKNQKIDKRRRKMRVLLLGRLEEDNGTKIYLEALKELKRQGISYNLIVCGDGSYRKQFEKYGKVQGSVSTLGKYIDRADFIFASSYLSIFEALSRGKNVFSVFQNELKEDYLELSPFKNFISIAGDARSLVENVIYISNNISMTYNNLEKARNWSIKQTWSKVADIYLKLWKL